MIRTLSQVSLELFVAGPAIVAEGGVADGDQIPEMVGGGHPDDRAVGRRPWSERSHVDCPTLVLGCGRVATATEGLDQAVVCDPRRHRPSRTDTGVGLLHAGDETVEVRESGVDPRDGVEVRQIAGARHVQDLGPVMHDGIGGNPKKSHCERSTRPVLRSPTR